MLDDFKTELRRLSLSMAQNATASAQAVMLDLGDVESPVLQHSSGAVRSRGNGYYDARVLICSIADIAE